MSFQMPHGKLIHSADLRNFFFLCWLAYTIAYQGRLNYGACLVEIVNAEGWTKGEAGLIATAFFTTYGLGQLLNGFTGDKICPKLMVGIGLGVSGLINLLFPLMGGHLPSVILWCLNGFAQSMIWSPMVRLISEWLAQPHRERVCVNMSSTVPVGTIAVYGLSAGLVFLGNWRLVFYTCGAIMLAVTLLWFLGIGRLEHRLQSSQSEPQQDSTEHPVAPVSRHLSFWRLTMISAIPLIGLAILTEGMLKDGVTTWIPTLLEEQFHLAAAGAILCTTVVPVVNLGGVYLAAWLNRRYFQNELLAAGIFFAFGFLSLLALLTVSGGSAAFAILLLALTTSFMMGINMLLIGLVPPFYVHYGVTSTITGILDFFAYVGSALSSYLNGTLVDHFGWNTIMLCWLGYAIFGLLMCLLAFRKWKTFRTESIDGNDN